MNRPGNSEDRSRPRRRLRLPWWGYPMIFIGVLAAGWVAWNLAMDAAIEAELQAIRDTGYPATPEELDAWYAYPAGPNAAEVCAAAAHLVVALDEADAAYVPSPGGTADDPDPGQPLPDEMKAAIARYLASNRAAMARARDAIGLDASRYVCDLSLGMTAPLPPTGGLRVLVNLFCLESILQAEQGNVDESLSALEGAAAVIRSLHDEPLIIPQLAQLATNAAMDVAINRIVNRVDLTDDQLRRIERIATGAFRPGGIARGLVGERVILADWRRRAGRAADLEIRLYARSGLAKRDWLLCYDLMNRQIEAALLAPDKQRPAMASVDAEIERIPARYPLARLVMATSFQRALSIEHYARFSRNATLTALALLRYRNATGTLPQALEALVPAYLDAVCIDTFTGGPIAYERIGVDGFILFSPGDEPGGRSRQRRRSDTNTSATCRRTLSSCTACRPTTRRSRAPTSGSRRLGGPSRSAAQRRRTSISRSISSKLL